LLVSALLIAMIPIHEAGHSLSCFATAGMPFPGLTSIGAYTSCAHVGKGDVGHRHDLYISGGMFAGIVALSLLAWPTMRKSAPFATAIILAATVQFAIAAVESLAWDFYTSMMGVVFVNVIYYLPVGAMAQNFRMKARRILAITPV
jgi:hypothetical protein